MVCKSLNFLAPGYLSSKFIFAQGYILGHTTLEILKISLLFPCHEPNTIEIASATAGMFCAGAYFLNFAVSKWKNETAYAN